MADIKQKFNQIKEFTGKIGKKTKALIMGGTIAVIAIAVIIALVLNNKNYTVLFSGITKEEATKIVGKLQESGVDYQYKENGDILVPEDAADQTRADLVYEGYPKSGFTYDVFKDNAGGMTTDSEKQTYKLYELQNRIGATVALFDGVKDAKVTIALADEKKYALEEEGSQSDSPSASVVVSMKDDGSPSVKQASAIQRLVAKSVPDMKMENVAVFDGNGTDISATQGESAGTSGEAGEEIAQLIESQISKKIINVLGPFYGSDNVRISAKGKVNMEKVIRETTTYSTPEKVDAQDKKGITSNESTSKDTSGTGAAAGGVAGAETNADTPQYNTNTTAGAGGYSSETATRDYLVNQIKEQGELDPGMLTDLTVSVSINGENFGQLSQNELRSLIGNATGIVEADREQKITIVSAPFYENKKVTEKDAKAASNALITPPVIAAAVVVAVIVLGLIIFLLGRRKRKRKMGEDEFADDLYVAEENTGKKQENPELLNLRNEKSRELRENVREFADQNPEISAQMLKTWLNGGSQDGGNSGE